jgi:hypothetical protein
MKSDKTPEAPADGSPGPGSNASAPAAAKKSSDLGLTERRHVVRPLPIPEVEESDGDTDWANFQALISDKPKS